MRAVRDFCIESVRLRAEHVFRDGFALPGRERLERPRDRRGWWRRRALRLSERLAPGVTKIARQARAILGLAAVPELMQTQGPWLNAGCVPLDGPPMIVLEGDLLDRLDEGTLRALMGHEL